MASNVTMFDGNATSTASEVVAEAVGEVAEAAEAVAAATNLSELELLQKVSKFILECCRNKHNIMWIKMIIS